MAASGEYAGYLANQNLEVKVNTEVYVSSLVVINEQNYSYILCTIQNSSGQCVLKCEGPNKPNSVVDTGEDLGAWYVTDGVGSNVGLFTIYVRPTV